MDRGLYAEGTTGVFDGGAVVVEGDESPDGKFEGREEEVFVFPFWEVLSHRHLGSLACMLNNTYLREVAAATRKLVEIEEEEIDNGL